MWNDFANNLCYLPCAFLVIIIHYESAEIQKRHATFQEFLALHELHNLLELWMLLCIDVFGFLNFLFNWFTLMVSFCTGNKMNWWNEKTFTRRNLQDIIKIQIEFLGLIILGEVCWMGCLYFICVWKTSVSQL